jgi:hypothetical protein
LNTLCSSVNKTDIRIVMVLISVSGNFMLLIVTKF